MRSVGKFYPSLRISHNLLMGLGVSDFVSVSHIFAFLSSHYTFSSWAQILKNVRYGKSRIYHSPRLHMMLYIVCMNQVIFQKAIETVTDFDLTLEIIITCTIILI